MTGLIRDNIEELRQRMGAETSDSEAYHMLHVLAWHGITEFWQIDEMDDAEFFALIPEAIARMGM